MIKTLKRYITTTAEIGYGAFHAAVALVSAGTLITLYGIATAPNAAMHIKAGCILVGYALICQILRSLKEITGKNEEMA